MEKEFEILAVESCVLLLELWNRSLSSTAVMSKDGDDSKEEEAMWSMGVTPVTQVMSQDQL